MAEENRTQKRQVAHKIRIKDIVNSRYVKEEGWTPNYIITSTDKKVSRVNIIGIIVSKPDENGANYSSIIIDDGSSRISARVFDDNKMFNSVEIGDVALLIGKPREYSQEMYIVPEIVKKITNKEWISVRKLELKNKGENAALETKPGPTDEKPFEDDAVVEEVAEAATGQLEKVYNLIRSMDHGDGADYQEIVEKTNAENEIEMLLKEGEIYEIRPGRLKVL